MQQVEHPSNLQENHSYHALAKSERKSHELACGAELRYMQRLHSAENAYAEKIAMSLGIGE